MVKTESFNSDLFDRSQNKFFVQGDSGIKYSYNNANIAAGSVLASQNFLNALEKRPALIEKYQNDTEKISHDIPVLEGVLHRTWKREDELLDLKSELTTLPKIQLSLKPILQGDATQQEVIGRIEYFGFRGNVDEVMEYTDKEEYLKAIKKELYQNPDGLRANTISKDPELRRNFDDLYYGECGADNKQTIDYHQNAAYREANSPIYVPNIQRGMRI